MLTPFLKPPDVMVHLPRLTSTSSVLFQNNHSGIQFIQLKILQNNNLSNLFFSLVEFVKEYQKRHMTCNRNVSPIFQHTISQAPHVVMPLH